MSLYVISSVVLLTLRCQPRDEGKINSMQPLLDITLNSTYARCIAYRVAVETLRQSCGDRGSLRLSAQCWRYVTHVMLSSVQAVSILKGNWMMGRHVSVLLLLLIPCKYYCYRFCCVWRIVLWQINIICSSISSINQV